jgi:hypothetical protein
VIPSEECPDLLLLYSDHFGSPEKHPVVDECWNGVVLDCKRMQVLAIGHTRVPHFPLPKDRKFQEPILTEKVEGIPCLLYFYQGKWRISSPQSPDGTSTPSSTRNLDLFCLFFFFLVERIGEH